MVYDSENFQFVVSKYAPARIVEIIIQVESADFPALETQTLELEILDGDLFFLKHLESMSCIYGSLCF